jgi:hypothetical protein
MLAFSVVYHGFEPWLDQTKRYKIGICCLHAVLRSKNKDCLAQNQDHMSGMSFFIILNTSRQYSQDGTLQGDNHTKFVIHTLQSDNHTIFVIHTLQGDNHTIFVIHTLQGDNHY